MGDVNNPNNIDNTNELIAYSIKTVLKNHKKLIFIILALCVLVLCVLIPIIFVDGGFAGLFK